MQQASPVQYHSSWVRVRRIGGDCRCSWHVRQTCGVLVPSLSVPSSVGLLLSLSEKTVVISLSDQHSGRQLWGDGVSISLHFPKHTVPQLYCSLSSCSRVSRCGSNRVCSHADHYFYTSLTQYSESSSVSLIDHHDPLSTHTTGAYAQS